MTPARALALLAELGASAWLVRHHELVVEAATILCDRLPGELDLRFDRDLVLAGAALHDAGKVMHPEEERVPGHAHERAGEQLLLARGVAVAIARCCVTHAAWDADDVAVEDLLVALADKLWKGKRVDDLEQRLAGAIARATRLDRWIVFSTLDALCEEIAADGPARLARSAIG
jgi:hypothetical protein